MRGGLPEGVTLTLADPHCPRASMESDMTTLTWLHLSDLHFRLNDPQDRKDPTDLIDPEDREGFESLLSDIKKIRKESKLDPDAVFFTGDVVFSGQKEQYDLVGKWFDEILEACDLSGQRDRLFMALWDLP